MLSAAGSLRWLRDIAAPGVAVRRARRGRRAAGSRAWRASPSCPTSRASARRTPTPTRAARSPGSRCATTAARSCARCWRASPTGCATRSTCWSSSAWSRSAAARRAAARARSCGCGSSPPCSSSRSSAPVVEEGAAYGAALLGGVAGGTWARHGRGRRRVRAGHGGGRARAGLDRALRRGQSALPRALPGAARRLARAEARGRARRRSVAEPARTRRRAGSHVVPRQRTPARARVIRRAATRSGGTRADAVSVGAVARRRCADAASARRPAARALVSGSSTGGFRQRDRGDAVAADRRWSTRRRAHRPAGGRSAAVPWQPVRQRQREDSDTQLRRTPRRRSSGRRRRRPPRAPAPRSAGPRAQPSAVRVGEEHDPAHSGSPGRRPRRRRARRASARAASASVDDHLQALDRARRRPSRQALADRDRAGRAGRGQLHEADLVADGVVVVGVEADLVDVERLRAVDVRAPATAISSSFICTLAHVLAAFRVDSLLESILATKRLGMQAESNDRSIADRDRALPRRDQPRRRLRQAAPPRGSA